MANDTLDLPLQHKEAKQAWAQWQPDTSPMVSALNTVKGAATAVLSTITAILNFVKGVLDIILAFILGMLDIETAALKAAIAIVRTAIKELLVNGAGFLLFVPPLAATAPADTNTLWEQVQATYGFDDNVKPLITASTGGVGGFLATVAASLSDPLDEFRPKFESDAYVAGVVMLAGASTFVELAPFIKKLRALFTGDEGGASSNLANDLDGSMVIPHPRGVRIKLSESLCIGDIINVRRGTLPHPYAVKISWDYDTTYGAINPVERYTIEKVHVYRAEASTLLRGLSHENLQPYHIADYDYQTGANTFYDADITQGIRYNYAIEYEITLESLSVDGEWYPAPTYFTSPSLTSFSIPEGIITSTEGVPPNWIAMPSPLAMIPGVSKFVRNMTQFLDGLEQRLDDNSAHVKKVIDGIKQDIDRYSKWANDLVATVQAIVDALTFPTVYIGVHEFYGLGGNGFLVSDLGRALTDPQDTSRPPFPLGTEAVCGLVMMAGSSIESKVAAFKNLLGMLFSTLENASNPIVAAVDSLGDSVDKIWAKQQLDASLAVTAEVAAVEAKKQGLDESLNPSDAQSDCAKAILRG